MDGSRTSGFLQRGDGKFLWDVMRVDGNQADRASVAHPPQSFQHAGRFQAETVMLGQRFGQHDLVRFGAAVMAGGNNPLRLGTSICRHNPVLAPTTLEHA